MAQQDPFQKGVVPNGSFQHGEIDSVNLLTGNVVIQSPLYSLPQTGRLDLSYAIIGNTPTYQSTNQRANTLYLKGVLLNYLSNYARPETIGPVVVRDHHPTPAWNMLVNQCNGNACAFDWATATESDGAVHQLYEDTQVLGTYRAVDGTGYTFVNDDPSNISSGGVLRDPNGVAYRVNRDSNNYVTLSKEADPDGNTISANPPAGSGYTPVMIHSGFSRTHRIEP
jgi:hypothetical protein